MGKLTKLSYLLLASFPVATVASAQMDTPKNNHYEVVSIRPGMPGKPLGVHFSPLQFRLDDYPLRNLIVTLYNVYKADELIGLPRWATSASFTINAKSIAPAGPLEQWGMLRPVLEDRFKLKYHREKRQMRVYFLVAAPGGIRFRGTVPGTCIPIDPKTGPTAPPRPGHPEQRPSCGLFLNRQLPEGGTSISVNGITMAQLAGDLGVHLDRHLVDKTGSTGLFDVVDLKFSTTDLAVNDTSLEPSGLPTMAAALKKAGLNITSGRDAIDVLVIDQLERPSEN